MSVVYVVMEHWNNCERYEDYANDSIVLKICANRNTAERVILNRRNELIKKAIKYRMAEEDCMMNYETIKNEDGTYAIKFIHTMSGNPFDTYNFGADYFRWSIEDHEIVES